MTKIKIYRQNENIVGFESSGHSGYAEYGSDIVCSAISSILLTSIIGLERVLGVAIKTTRDDKKGYLKVVLKNSELDAQKSQVIFQTMLQGLKEVERAYKKYLKLEDDYEIF